MGSNAKRKSRSGTSAREKEEGEDEQRAEEG